MPAPTPVKEVHESNDRFDNETGRNQELRELIQRVDVIGKEIHELRDRVGHSTASAKEFHELVQRVEFFGSAVRRLEESIAPSLTAADDDKLKKFDQITREKSQWPKSAAEAQLLHDEFAAFFKSLKPAVQDDHLARLLPVKWAVEVILAIRKGEALQDGGADEFYAELNDLLGQDPSNASADLITELGIQIKKAETAANKRRRDSLIQLAQSALRPDGDAVVALERLGPLSGPDVDKLRSELKSKIDITGVVQQIKLYRQLLAVAGDVSNKPFLRQASASRVQEESTALLLDLNSRKIGDRAHLGELGGIVDESQHLWDKLVAEQQAELQRAGAKKVRDYQRWTLDSLRSYEKEEYDLCLKWTVEQLNLVGSLADGAEWQLLAKYPWSKKLIQQKLGVPMADVEGARLTRQKRDELYNNLGFTGWKNNIDQEIAYRAVRESMILYLLPINTSYLEPPVARHYQKAFDKGWEKLEGRNDQLEVEKATITVEKRQLD
jgi:hypothetical protein